MSDWHGWSRRDSEHGALHIGELPGRKSVCLYSVVGSVLDVHAYFRTPEHAERVLAWLDDFAGPRVQWDITGVLPAPASTEPEES